MSLWPVWESVSKPLKGSPGANRALGGKLATRRFGSIWVWEGWRDLAVE